jgi:predicted ATPase
MRLSAFHAEDIQPIKLMEADALSDVVVLAGPNGVGKSRFLQWLLNHFQNPTGSAQNWVVVEATSDLEKATWESLRSTRDIHKTRSYLFRPSSGEVGSVPTHRAVC